MEKMEKPKWITNKEKDLESKRMSQVWLFGIHAVNDALQNPNRVKHSLMITPNAHKKLINSIEKCSVKTQIIDPRKFFPPIEKQSVHQGAAMQVSPLNWGSLSEICAPKNQNKLVLLLDRVTDPHNVGAILRSAEVFGTTAVVTPTRYSVPETGSLAKSASGSLERQPYLRVPNLAHAIESLKEMGYFCIGLDGTSDIDIVKGLSNVPPGPIALIVGSEGPGLRELTLKNCDAVVKISSYGSFGSLNVSNAAAIALSTARAQIYQWSVSH
jgi:23S rRNA (guanosine2251-2'-O)-methyltransferase